MQTFSDNFLANWYLHFVNILLAQVEKHVPDDQQQETQQETQHYNKWRQPPDSVHRKLREPLAKSFAKWPAPEVPAALMAYHQAAPV